MPTKKYFFYFILLLVISCSTPKKVVYFQESIDKEGITSSNNFNLLYKIANQPNILGSVYVVNSNGNIHFPVLGKLKVVDLNQLQVQDLIQEQLKAYVNSALVSVRLKNFKITILGEVNNPGVYSISDERITIVEALGLAKDLKIRGKRESITVVRESNEGKVYHKIDITSKNIFDSPIYYLKQNDVVYVEPNKAQILSSKNNNWTRILTTVGSILSIALSAVALSR